MSKAGSCWGYFGVAVLVQWQCIICLVCRADSNSVFFYFDSYLCMLSLWILPLMLYIPLYLDTIITLRFPQHLYSVIFVMECCHKKAFYVCLTNSIQVPIVASNRIGKEIIQTEHGNSEITFHGKSFIAGPAGEIVAAGDKEEAVLVAKVDLELIKSKRHSWSVFRDQRPDLYEVLLTLDGSDPVL